MLERYLLGRFAVIGHFTCEHLIHDHAERIYIAARIRGLTSGLLGGDIVYGAHCLITALLLSALKRSYAKVGNLYSAVAQYHDVLRLYIAVDYALVMRVL